MADRPAEAEVNRSLLASVQEYWRPDTPPTIGDLALTQSDGATHTPLTKTGEDTVYESD